MMRNTNHQTPMALHLLNAIAPQDTPRPGGSRQLNRSRGEQNKGSGGGGGSKRTHSECDSEPRQNSRQTERARNWAEQRRGQYQQPPQFYRGSNIPPRGRGQFSAGGGGDSGFQVYGRGRRPYTGGWAPRGKGRY
jgi:hypothetical protein